MTRETNKEYYTISLYVDAKLFSYCDFLSPYPVSGESESEQSIIMILSQPHHLCGLLCTNSISTSGHFELITFIFFCDLISKPSGESHK